VRGVASAAGLGEWPRRVPPPSAADIVPAQDWPRVSLVTPSFNQARFLEDTILSVLHQGYPDLEYMVIDGGSTDGSLEIIQRYAERLAHWESAPDLGQSHAINKGWQRATGKYVWWLNSDDLLMPGSLASTVQYLEAHSDVDLVYGDIRCIDEDGRPLKTWSYRDFELVDFILNRRHVAQAGGLVRRHALERIGFLDEGLHYLMDWDFWTRLALSGGRIGRLPQTLAIYRVHDEAKTGAGSPVAVQERYTLLRRLLDRADLPERIRANEARVVSGMRVDGSRVFLACGAYKEAAREAIRACRVWPPQVLSPAVWYQAGLGVLGILLGERTWRGARAVIRRWRRSWRAGIRRGGP